MNRHRLLLTVVVLVNVIGTVFGYYYYEWLFLSSPIKLWIFIPDSPNSTILFAVSLALLVLKRKQNWLSYIASIASMKYGFWTMFVILFYSDYFLSPPNRLFYYVMFILHFGMVVQPVIILHTVDLKPRHLLIALAWFLLNDYFDYIKNLSSLYSYSFDRIEAVALVASISTIVISLAIYYIAKTKKEKLIGILERYLDKDEIIY